MFITIHAGGMPFNGETIAQQSLGGSESAAYYLARELVARDHNVTVFTSSRDQGRWDGVTYVYHGAVSPEKPLGEAFHYRARYLQNDAIVIQRNPLGFAFAWNSKCNLLWLHDLARKRLRSLAAQSLWNVDALLPVSAWHGLQVAEAWGVRPEIVKPLPNGIDPALYEGKIESGTNNIAERMRDLVKLHHGGGGDVVKLIYVSRPERGLEHLVAPDGIMERLACSESMSPDAPRYHLFVCGYDNTTPEMAPLYRELWGRIEALPNCTALGYLTKAELAGVQRCADAWVYPSDFEETSCISAMEAMAAGLPIIASDVGALPDTVDEYDGAGLIPLKNGGPDIDAFMEQIALTSPGMSVPRHFPHTWETSADVFEETVAEILAAKTSNSVAVGKHLHRLSDIKVLERAIKATPNDLKDSPHWGGHPVAARIEADLDECYAFAREETFAGHYAAYYRYEAERGMEYGPEELDGNARYETVARHVGQLPEGARVLDYGCAHGHYTINLAKRFPKLEFIGIDLVASNIEKAKAWREKDDVKNVAFLFGDEVPMRYLADPFDLIIAAEVLEHVNDPGALADRLAESLKEGGRMVITTPFGPWEGQKYRQHHPWRAHLHHLERADLFEMFGHHPDFGIVMTSAGQTARGEALGSFVTHYAKPTEGSRAIDMARKFSVQAPRETVTLAMIVKDGEARLRRCLDSAAPIIDELVIALDETTSDRTEDVIHAFVEDYPDIAVRIFPGKSPLEVGFDEARNATVERASCQWILWLDHDEVLHGAETLALYLRPNQFNAYAMRQVHYGFEPLGIDKIDLPAKIFRNHIGMRFIGMVHEHPETGLNEGQGWAMALPPEITVAHDGYDDESTRLKRFQRNHPLFIRDREKYPERNLAKFLWIRELEHVNRYELQRNGMVITEAVMERAREGIALWRELAEGGFVRWAKDAVEFYSNHARVLGEGFEAAFGVDAAMQFNGKPADVSAVEGYFASVEDLQLLARKAIENKTADLGGKYW